MVKQFVDLRTWESVTLCNHASGYRCLEKPTSMSTSAPPAIPFSRQPRRRRIRHANSAHAAPDSDHRRPGSDRRVRGHGRHHADGREAARGRGQSPADPRLRAGHWAAGQDRWTHHRSELCLSRSPTRVGQGAGIDRDPSTSGASFYYCYCWSVRSSEASDMHPLHLPQEVSGTVRSALLTRGGLVPSRPRHSDGGRLSA